MARASRVSNVVTLREDGGVHGESPGWGHTQDMQRERNRRPVQARDKRAGTQSLNLPVMMEDMVSFVADSGDMYKENIYIFIFKRSPLVS